MRRKLTSLSLLAFLGFGAIAFAQTTGTVNDKNGFPEMDVPVQVKGTNTIVYTDENGGFSINAKVGDVLLINGKEVLVTRESLGTIEASVVSDNIDLEETVITAYGTQKKETVVGSVSTVKAEDIENRPLTNVAKALDGTVTGVRVSTGSGQPGSGLSVQVRGVGSYNLSSSPLYVVDGVIYAGSLQDLNPNDIESLTVLKDAASTSLYGSSAANGVVMITTKKGKKGKKGQFRFTSNTGVVTRGIPEYSRLGADDYYVAAWTSMRNGYLVTDKSTVAAANAKASANLISGNLKNNIYRTANNQVVVDGVITGADKLYNDFDWQDYITRVGTFQKYDVDYSGATDNTNYFASFGYNKETGYVIKSDFERYSARANVDSQVTDWLKLGVNLNGSLVKSLQANSDGGSSYINPFYTTRAMGPIYSPFLYDNNGQRVYDTEGNAVYDGNLTRGRGASASAGRNVLQETLLNNALQNTNSINSRFSAEFKLAKGLTFTTNLSYDIRNYRLKSYGNKVIGDASGTASLAVTNQKYTTSNFNQILNYKTKIGNHNIDAILGHENWERLYEYTYQRKIGEVVSGIYELINFLENTSNTGYNNELKKEGYFARLNYDYANKYLLSGSVRVDKSSRFADDNNTGVFWSVGAGWNLHKEDFLSSLSFLNELKLRASYGQVGNDGGTSGEPGYQVDLDLYSLGYNNGGEPGLYMTQVGNKDLTWESKNKFDVGLDFSILNRRISGNFDYYLEDVVDMIFGFRTPNSAGVPGNEIYRNVGTMRNSGIEVGLNFGIIRNDKFSWDLNLMGSTVKNKMLKMPGGKDDVITANGYRLAEGKSVYEFWQRQWYGVDPTDGSPLFLQNEGADDANTRIGANGEKLTTNQNRGKYDYSGSSIPDLFGSITNNFKIGNFDVLLALNYQIGGKVYDGNYASLMSTYPQGNALHVDMLNAWKNPGDITNVPIMSSQNVNAAGAASTRWIKDASYLTIRSVQVGYNFSKRDIESIGLKNLRVYLSGENLHAWTAGRGLEPAQSLGGGTSYRYTPSRNVSIGLNVSF